MIQRPPARRRSSYWLVPAFLALMLAPPTWAITALIAAAACVTAARGWGIASGRQRMAAARSPSIVLGCDRAGREVRVSDSQLSAHGLILGASGAGKSTTLLRILTAHTRRGLPVVAIDMKGSPAFARQLADAAAAAGRRFRLWTPDGPGHWNPLQYGNATELKDKLIATERFTEPHYQRAAERYLQTVLQVLRHADGPHAPTLERVVQLMDPQRMATSLRGVPRPLRERVQDYLDGLTPDQLSAVRGLQTRLAIITESHTGAYLLPAAGRHEGVGGTIGAGAAKAAADVAIEVGRAADRSIDLRRALLGGEVVVFSLNSSTYGRLAAQIGTLVVQDLVSAVGDRLSHRPLEGLGRATVGIDEFSALGADHVIALLARGREAGVGTLLATQELADLDRAAPGLRDQVLGNTAVKIAHRQDVPSSAQTVAQMAGTENAWEETYQVGGPLPGGYRTGRGTRRAVEQFIVHPNEIKTLRTGDAVLISKLGHSRAQTVRVRAPQRDARELGR